MLAAVSNIWTKTPDTINETSKMTIPGKTGELTGDSFMLNLSIKRLEAVVKIAIDSFAINIKNSENPSTKANFALFLSIKIKELIAEEQKLSLDIAI